MRRKLASWFGSNEHNFAELLGLALLLNVYLQKDWWSLVLMTWWLIYYLSHRMEKLIYGHHGYR